MHYKEENKVSRYRLSDKVNPLTIAGLILLFSVILTTGGQYEYMAALVFASFILSIFSLRKAFGSICVISAIWLIIYLMKPYIGNVFLGSIYTLLLIMLKFSPIFILGRALSSFSSSHLMSAFRKIGIGGNIGIGIAIFFRFVPEISIRMKEINDGMKIRGFKPALSRPLKTFELYFVPLIYKCIDISDTLTCSIISKGIEYKCKKTSFHEVKFTFADIILLIFGILLTGVCIWKIFWKQI